LPYRLPTRTDWFITGLLVTFFTAAIVASAVLIASKRPLGFVLLACSLLLLLVRWHAANFAYQCPACGNEFEISTLQDLISPHMLSTKYLRCPACGKRDWTSILKKTPGHPIA
jgi:DNA-directed RNA polymerase subunit RPC12/RpoP